MLMIRFQRIGRTNDPAFRIVLTEKTRAAKAGSINEQLGTYNPRSKALTLDAEKIKNWIAKGAQPTDSIRNLLITKGILTGKKVNVLPKKSPIKSEEPEVPKEAPAPVTTEEKVEEVAAPTEGEIVAEVESEPEPEVTSEA